MRRTALFRVLGVGFGVAVAIGGTVGAGILRTPGGVAAELRSVGWILAVWVGGGLYALLAAFGIAELGAMIPRAGGHYVFAQRALGRYAGFVVGWSDWIAGCGSVAALAIFFGETLARLVPELAGREPVVAGVVVLSLALLQWRGIRWGSSTQNLTSAVKALGFLALVAAWLVVGGARGSDAVAPAPHGLALGAAIIAALQMVIWTYDGWYGGIYFSEEVRQPERDIPRSMIAAVLLVMSLYVLVNVALLRVLPFSRLVGAEMAAGDATAVVLGGHSDFVLNALVAVSVLSTINAILLAAPRILFAMARDGLIFEKVVDVNEGGTPTNALFVSTGIVLGFILSGTFARVISVLSFFLISIMSISLLSVFVLRMREPAAERPYRAFGYPFTTAIALLSSIAFLAGAAASDWANGLIALVVLALSVPAYLILRRFSVG